MSELNNEKELSTFNYNLSVLLGLSSMFGFLPKVIENQQVTYLINGEVICIDLSVDNYCEKDGNYANLLSKMVQNCNCRESFTNDMLESFDNCNMDNVYKFTASILKNSLINIPREDYDRFTGNVQNALPLMNFAKCQQYFSHNGVNIDCEFNKVQNQVNDDIDKKVNLNNFLFDYRRLSKDIYKASSKDNTMANECETNDIADYYNNTIGDMVKLCPEMHCTYVGDKYIEWCEAINYATYGMKKIVKKYMDSDRLINS